MHTRTTVLASLPRPRHAASAVADVAASHAGLRGPFLSIECVRTYAPAISTGALAVFRAFSTLSPRRRPAALVASIEPLEIIWLFKLQVKMIYASLWRAQLASYRRLAQWFDTVV